MAQARASEALARIARGEVLARRERKVPYNGAEGMPIREEIVHEAGDLVVTRNAYGARCLNVPGVLFADVDVDPKPGVNAGCAVAIGLVLGAFVLGLSGVRGPVVLWWFLAIGLGLFSVLRLGRWVVRQWRGKPEQVVRRRLSRWLKAHADWRVRLYRTPAGFRLLAVHRVFDPNEPQVAAFFKALAVDPLFARMCFHQHCFRARLSGKPWRMGIEESLRPRPGVWPIPAEHLPARAAWVSRYEKQAANFAACQFIEEFGEGAVDGRALAVQRYHDEHARARTALPLA